jgi:CheY-like chemotaxis protein
LKSLVRASIRELFLQSLCRFTKYTDSTGETSEKDEAETVFAASETRFDVAGGDPSASSDLKGLRVLLIDDEKDTLEMLAAMLARSGVAVETQTNVKAALAVVERWLPQIIVSDIGMPEMDGYDLIEKLRALPAEKGGTIPVIALTAYAGITEQKRVLSSGFEMYLPKPIVSSELLDALARLADNFNRTETANASGASVENPV